MKKVCIAFITHKSKLDGKEEKAFLRCLEVFGSKRNIKMIIPNNISTEYYDKYKDIIEICQVNYEWLKDSDSYNKMCCESEFYKMFSEYEYVLIYQTDCWVFGDRLDEFIDLGFDYYGAPWSHLNNKVGNGGLSLRKVQKMIEITSRYKFNFDSLERHEDTWFCITHGHELNICDFKTACEFSIEQPRKTCLSIIKKIPMGLHGRDIYKFWDDGTKLLELKKEIK